MQITSKMSKEVNKINGNKTGGNFNTKRYYLEMIEAANNGMIGFTTSLLGDLVDKGTNIVKEKGKALLRGTYKKLEL